MENNLTRKGRALYCVLKATVELPELNDVASLRAIYDNLRASKGMTRKY